MRGRTKALIAVGLSLTALGGVAVVSATSAKPRTSIGIADVPGLDPAAELRDITVAVAVDDPSTLGCTGGWAGFANPLEAYSFCYPAAWGFTTLEAPKPLIQLAGTMLGSIRLLSNDAFPWTPGVTPLSAIEGRDIVSVEVSAVPAHRPNAVDTGDCTPLEPIGSALVCDQLLDASSGEVSESGTINELLAVFSPSDPGGTSLIVRGQYQSGVKRDTLVRLVASMRPSPLGS